MALAVVCSKSVVLLLLIHCLLLLTLFVGVLCVVLVVPTFFFKKKGYIKFCTKSVHSPSVTFLVNVSPPKRLDIATFIGHMMTSVKE